MLDLIKMLFTSSKPHHVISGSLFLMLSVSVFHVYAQQEKLSEQKADNASVVQLLAQNQQLLEINQQSASGNTDLQRVLVASIISLETRLTQSQAEQQERVVNLTLRQELLKSQLEKQLAVNEEILKRLDQLNAQMATVNKNP